MKLLLIYNLHAGHKKAGKIFNKIKTRFVEKGIELDVKLTEYRWHGIELVKNSDLQKYDGVIAAGGDGTLFEVINGYYQNRGSGKPPIGLLPMGTGNAFARDLDLRTFEWEKAINIICSGKTRKVDVAQFSTEGKIFYYLNILGLGFVADVGVTAHPLKFLGNFAYTVGVFYQMVFLKTFKIEIKLDGKNYERENIFVEISNTRWTGSTFLMAPEAEIDDGFLDVILLNKVSRRKLLRLFPTIFNGTHVNMDEVEAFKARKITIHSNIPKILAPDGELAGSTPVEIECLHQAIEVFCP
ncbi:MAG: diacylglycerol kinase family lipid kinase [Calditrichaeota bacterium]|nr:diacylglycerol kinase family lipid kinase [Calditrichota bacterium]